MVRSSRRAVGLYRILACVLRDARRTRNGRSADMTALGVCAVILGGIVGLLARPAMSGRRLIALAVFAYLAGILSGIEGVGMWLRN